MAKYTEQAKVEAYLQRALTEQESAILDDIISVVSRIISKYCNRIWRGLDEELDEYTDENEQRIFDGNGQRELHLDEFTSIELLELMLLTTLLIRLIQATRTQFYLDLDVSRLVSLELGLRLISAQEKPQTRL